LIRSRDRVVSEDALLADHFGVEAGSGAGLSRVLTA
jgi:hypothetical protein